MQYLLFSQLLTIIYTLIIVQFGLDPWLWPYGVIFWSLGGGFATVLSVAFSIVTAKAPIGSPLRWITILSMEVAIQLGSLLMVNSNTKFDISYFMFFAMLYSQKYKLYIRYSIIYFIILFI